MQFEGLTITGPQDIERLIRGRQGTNVYDVRPWAWLPRFVDAHSKHRPWVRDALLAIVSQALGSDDPDELGDEMFRLGQLCGVAELGQIAADVVLDLTEDVGSEEAARHLERLLGFWPVALDADELAETLDRVQSLGLAAETFRPAFNILVASDAARAVSLTSAHFANPDAPEDLDDAIGVVALHFFTEELEPLRPALARAVVQNEEAIEGFIAILEMEAMDPEEATEAVQFVRDALEVELPDKPAGAAPLCITPTESIDFSSPGAVVSAFVSACALRDVEAARAVAVLPADGERVGLPDAFTEYAEAVQAELPSYIDGFPAVKAIGDVGEPRSMGPDTEDVPQQDAPPVALLWVPITLKLIMGVTRDEFMVYRFGDVHKVGLFLAGGDKP